MLEILKKQNKKLSHNISVTSQFSQMPHLNVRESQNRSQYSSNFENYQSKADRQMQQIKQKTLNKVSEDAIREISERKMEEKKNLLKEKKRMDKEKLVWKNAEKEKTH